MADAVLQLDWYGGPNARGEPMSNGFISVEPSGSLSVSPIDDYYGGTIAAPQALQLAAAIILAQVRNSGMTTERLLEFILSEEETSG